MNKKELKEKLEKANVRPWYYNIDEFGETDQRLCLEQVDDKWRTCFYERGQAGQVKFYETESEACQYMLDILIKANERANS